MTIRALPGVPMGRPQIDVRSYISPQAMSRWDAGIRAKDEEDERVIGIYDVIGEDFCTGGGFTAKRLAGALRSLGKGPVTVAINSPGGDMFDGFAMYSMLREHSGEVTVKVMGLAASAASIIAMAGDKVEIARPAFLMIHNCWLMAIGNRHDLREVADQIESFDDAMADVYAAHTGDDKEDIAKLMDRETWIGGSAAVEQGFADSLLDSDQIDKREKDTKAAVRRMEAALRASGMSKADAMTLISEFKSGARDATGSGERDATERGAGDPAVCSQTAALAALRSFI
jgi:ATP-dependent protease ClpP protease subunit